MSMYFCRIWSSYYDDHPIFDSFYYSHKNRKGSLETRDVLLIFSLELKISGVAVQRMHSSSKKWWFL